jgi:hypothetical protein
MVVSCGYADRNSWGLEWHAVLRPDGGRFRSEHLESLGGKEGYFVSFWDLLGHLMPFVDLYQTCCAKHIVSI